MATTEHTVNDALAGTLMETRSLWRFKGVVRSENIDVLKGSGKRPDILITEPNVSPVIVETEILPAISVESDAKQRLGDHLTPSGRRILSSVAVGLPPRLRDFSGQPLKNEFSAHPILNWLFIQGRAQNHIHVGRGTDGYAVMLLTYRFSFSQLPYHRQLSKKRQISSLME